MTEEDLLKKYGERIRARLGEDFRNTERYRKLIAQCVNGARYPVNAMADWDDDIPAKQRNGW